MINRWSNKENMQSDTLLCCCSKLWPPDFCCWRLGSRRWWAHRSLCCGSTSQCPVQMGRGCEQQAVHSDCLVLGLGISCGMLLPAALHCSAYLQHPHTHLCARPQEARKDYLFLHTGPVSSAFLNTRKISCNCIFVLKCRSLLLCSLRQTDQQAHKVSWAS